jgi:predicted amidohydrolase YtcJ
MSHSRGSFEGYACLELSSCDFCQTRILGITIDPAYASFAESTLGSLVPGKRADFVVLSQDIMSVPAHKILETKVLATVLDGTPIYGHL